MSEDFACPNCQHQSVIYQDASKDDAIVECRTCGAVLGTLAQFRRFIERHVRRDGGVVSHC